jgi:hypothetical protein
MFSSVVVALMSFSEFPLEKQKQTNKKGFGLP